MTKPRITLHSVQHTLAEMQCFTAERRQLQTWASTDARAHHEAMLGKVVEIDYLEISSEGEQVEYRADAGRPFIVRVMPTDRDNLALCIGTHLDPRWDIEIVDGRGKTGTPDPEAWVYMFGPAIEYVRETEMAAA